MALGGVGPDANIAARTRGVCVIVGGTIGSLIAGHLSRVAEVCLLTRRAEHAKRIEDAGLRVSGKSTFIAYPHAVADPEISELRRSRRTRAQR